LLAPRPIPKMEDHPLLSVRGCLFNKFAANLHCWWPFLPQPVEAPCFMDKNPHLSWKIIVLSEKKLPVNREILCVVPSVVLCCDVLCCDVLWCDVLCCVVMWCVVMWCDVMCCDVLCCDVMCCVVLCSSDVCCVNGIQMGKAISVIYCPVLLSFCRLCCSSCVKIFCYFDVCLCLIRGCFATVTKTPVEIMSISICGVTNCRVNGCSRECADSCPEYPVQGSWGAWGTAMVSDHPRPRGWKADECAGLSRVTTAWPVLFLKPCRDPVAVENWWNPPPL
jgi:hypothetical protein